MKKIIIAFILFSFNASAQQYWHRVKGGCGDIGTGEAVVCLFNDSVNNLLYACGSFKTADDTISADGIAFWNGSEWDSNFPYPNGATGLPENVSLTLFQNMIYCSSQYGGGAVFHYDGTSWSQDGSFNDNTNCMCVYHNKLYVGGDFTNVDGMPASFIACYDGTSWSALGSGIWCTQFPGDVKAMCVWNDKLIVGGSFDQAGGTSVHGVVAWNDTTWSDVGGGVIDNNAPTQVAFVNALCVHDNDLIVGGRLTHGGGTVPASDICRFDGSNWFALGNGIIGGDVLSLLSWDSTLYIGGDFASCGWVSNTHWIGKWDGNNYHPVGDSLQGIIYTMCVYDSVLYVGGIIPLINHHSVNNIARLLDYPDTTNYDAVKEISESEDEIKIYPNPVQNQVTVSELKQGAQIQVSDITGRVLIQTTESIIDVSYLSSGIYLLEIKTMGGKSAVKKFVKE